MGYCRGERHDRQVDIARPALKVNGDREPTVFPHIDPVGRHFSVIPEHEKTRSAFAYGFMF